MTNMRPKEVKGGYLATVFLSNGSGPMDGHPELMTPHRTELSGIVALCYIIARICGHYNISSGHIMVYCDNTGVIKNVFQLGKPGITPYFNTDHDLVEVTKHLIQL
jgi:hypothetical protein